MNRYRLICESSFMKSTKEPVTTSVSGEYAPGSITAVGGRRKPYHQEACSWIAETRDWPGPIFLIGKAANFLASDSLAPLDQTRAQTAPCNAVLQRSQGI